MRLGLNILNRPISGLEFQKLNAIQQAKLKDFMFSHGAENGVHSVNEQVSFKQIPDT